MKALKTVAVALGITLAALIVIPLAVLAGLFVWLKVTAASRFIATDPSTESSGTGTARRRPSRTCGSSTARCPTSRTGGGLSRRFSDPRRPIRARR